MRAINWNAVNGVSSVAVAVVAILALIFTGVQIHAYREETKVQHLMELVREFEAQRFAGIRRSLASQRIDTKLNRLKKLDPDNPPGEMLDELNFCVDVGLLTSRGALNVHDVWSEFGYWLFPVYYDSRPVI